MKIIYTASFLKKFKSLEKDLQEEILEKIEFFKDKRYHKLLKVHKLHGRLFGRFAFSVNYKIRIVFGYFSKDEVVFHNVGDHNIYN